MFEMAIAIFLSGQALTWPGVMLDDIHACNGVMACLTWLYVMLDLMSCSTWHYGMLDIIEIA